MRTIIIAFILLTTPVAYSFTPNYAFPADNEVVKEMVSGPGKNKIPSIFSILVWNVHKGEDGDAWAHDLYHLTLSEDLVLLQEGMIDDYMPGVFNQMGNKFNFHIGISFSWKNKFYQTGPVTAASATPADVSFRRSPGREPLIKTPKIILLTKHLLDNGKTLLAANIHAINFVHNDHFRDQIEDVIPTLQKHDGPVVFAGDFNTWNEPRLNYLTERLAKIDLNLVELPIDNRKFKLDHIFVKGCKASNALLLSHIKTSDHAPIRAMLNCK